jgi:hypothetical protein
MQVDENVIDGGGGGAIGYNGPPRRRRGRRRRPNGCRSVLLVREHILSPRRGSLIVRDEDETTSLSFTYEVGVYTYSICLAGRQWGICHDPPNEGGCQLFELNHFL